jgi:hypothetical protein
MTSVSTRFRAVAPPLTGLLLSPHSSTRYFCGEVANRALSVRIDCSIPFPKLKQDGFSASERLDEPWTADRVSHWHTLVPSESQDYRTVFYFVLEGTPRRSRVLTKALTRKQKLLLKLGDKIEYEVISLNNNSNTSYPE